MSLLLANDLADCGVLGLPQLVVRSLAAPMAFEDGQQLRRPQQRADLIGPKLI
ncbi:MAG TPA: hypothetical protein VK457_22905 [Chloroflexota bacterium]|nr:hypothetical protein [Chloroflexota bacterium]